MSTAHEHAEASAAEHRSPWLYVSFFGKEPWLEGVSVDCDGIRVVELGRARATKIERIGDRVVIGVADSEVSSRHIELRATTHRGGVAFTVEDLGSTNGTYLFRKGAGAHVAPDGRVSGRRVVRHDCCVCVGSVAMHLVLDQPSWGPRGLVTWARDLPRRAEGLATLVPEGARDVDASVRLAATDVTLTLVGEAGSGRSTRARALHAWSKRSSGPFVVVNGGVVTSAAESFFARTFAEARGGTLFVRNPGKMHPGGQDLLLRVLRAGEYLPSGASRVEPLCARLMVALDPTDAAPIAELERVTRGRELSVPPLRDRMPDLGLVLGRLLTLENQSSITFGADAVRALVSQSFPGNLSQLADVIAAVAAVEGGVVRAADLLLPRGAAVAGAGDGAQGRKAVLVRHLEDANGNISEVARRMKTSRSQVHRWLGKLGIKRLEGEPDDG